MMISEHEIPQGAKLYFAKTAKLKRQIEQSASEIFYHHGFEEIITPSFSFLQHQRNFSNRKIIRLSSENNQQISLRYDSTIDTIRIITKRLTRSTGSKKWFYIQPVFNYPSHEINQIGVECLEPEAFNELFNLVLKLFEQWKIKPYIQISNTNIASLCANALGIQKEKIFKAEVDTLLKNPLLCNLFKIQNLQDLQEFIKIAPSFLKIELQRLFDHVKHFKYDQMIISTIQDVPVDYYCDITFRAFIHNETLLLGGNYKIDTTPSCGFAIYTDNILSILHNKE